MPGLVERIDLAGDQQLVEEVVVQRQQLPIAGVERLAAGCQLPQRTPGRAEGGGAWLRIQLQQTFNARLVGGQAESRKHFAATPGARSQTLQALIDAGIALVNARAVATHEFAVQALHQVIELQIVGPVLEDILLENLQQFIATGQTSFPR